VASFTVDISAVLYAITMHMIQKMMHVDNIKLMQLHVQNNYSAF